MARFVWMDVVGAGAQPVNPDQVCYIKRSAKHRAVLVFGAMPGGFHELELAMGVEDAVTLLSATPAPHAP